MSQPAPRSQNKESMFRDGQEKGNSWLVIHSDRGRQKQRIKDGERKNRGEERECFEALSLEVFPCNVTSYCLHGAQDPLPQVMWQASASGYTLANEYRATTEKVKSRLSPLSGENLRPSITVLFINIQLLLNGLHSDVSMQRSARHLGTTTQTIQNMWSFFLAWHHSQCLCLVFRSQTAQKHLLQSSNVLLYGGGIPGLLHG